MADNYINPTGLQAIKTWIVGKFATITSLNTLSDRVDDIVAEGGEPNKIDTVKVNGTALVPDAEKAVSLNGATQEQTTRWYIRDYRDVGKIIEFAKTDDGVNVLSTSNGFDQNDWVKNLVDKDYVDANGGKIDKIKVNGTEQTITNKEVNIAVPIVEMQGYQDIRISPNSTGTGFALTQNTDGMSVTTESGTNQLVSKVYVDDTFQTEAEVQALIDAELTSLYKPGGTVEFASLPALTKDNVGYIYDIIDSFTTTADFVEGAGKTYPAHTNVGIIDKGAAGLFYDVFSGMVDMSGYWSSIPGQPNTLTAMTVSEINAILNA